MLEHGGGPEFLGDYYNCRNRVNAVSVPERWGASIYASIYKGLNKGLVIYCVAGYYSGKWNTSREHWMMTDSVRLPVKGDGGDIMNTDMTIIGGFLNFRCNWQVFGEVLLDKFQDIRLIAENELPNSCAQGQSQNGCRSASEFEN